MKKNVLSVSNIVVDDFQVLSGYVAIVCCPSSPVLHWPDAGCDSCTQKF